MGTPLPSPQDAISEDGFFKADNPELGERVQQMDEDGVALNSERGLHFYSTNVLQHPVSIISILWIPSLTSTANPPYY